MRQDIHDVSTNNSRVFFRDPTNFHKRTEYKSNGVDTPLNCIPEFNITEDIPLDPMHLLDLGTSIRNKGEEPTYVNSNIFLL